MPFTSRGAKRWPRVAIVAAALASCSGVDEHVALADARDHRLAREPDLQAPCA